MNNSNEHNDAPTSTTQETITPEQKKISELEATIATLTVQLQQAQERAQYLTADFENIRRRFERDSQTRIDAAQATLLSELITLVDDFERAFESLQTKPELMPFVTGFELTYKALQKLLTTHQVTGIDAAPGMPFNPELHEAITQTDAPDIQSHCIVSVLQKGYRYKGSVLRPAKVSVKP